jgi:hypothetical protein
MSRFPGEFRSSPVESQMPRKAHKSVVEPRRLAMAEDKQKLIGRLSAVKRALAAKRAAHRVRGRQA